MKTKKMKKFAVLCMLAISIETLSACGTKEKETASEQPQVESEKETESVAVQENTETEGFSFADLKNIEFGFCSGAGAWGTGLRINADGTFEGDYHDSDMGDTGDGYPGGIVYQSTFKGKFSKPVKINEYTYSTRIEEINLKEKPGKEEIIDSMKFIYSDPYGLDGDPDEFYIYLPGAPIDQLPEEYVNWIKAPIEIKDSDKELPFYGLYNVVPQYGFYSSVINGETSADNGSGTSDTIQNEKKDGRMTEVEKKAAELEAKLKSDSATQSDLIDTSAQLFKLWDDELNTIWGELKLSLDTASMKTLTEDERTWISWKEEEVKKAGAEYEGGSIQSMVENQKAAELTKERVYELRKKMN